MADAIQNVFVMLCDWRGHVVWTSWHDEHLKIGDLSWSNLPPAFQELAKEAHGKVVGLRQPQTLQVVNLQGKCFRGWMWPLDCPETAVCALLQEVPAALREITVREIECLELLGQGIETREIAERLDVSLSTVHTHLKRAREKLGLPGVEALISFAARYCYPQTRPFLKEGTEPQSSHRDSEGRGRLHEGH